MTTEPVRSALRGHLRLLYGDEVAARTLPRLEGVLDTFTRTHSRPVAPGRSAEDGPFDERDVVLVCYGDQVREPGRPPLDALRRFLTDRTDGLVTGVHLLPHYPYTSDDGFAVTDYTAVDPDLGGWADVERLAADFRLMLDAVVNHTSASHPWLTGWLRDDPALAGFYLEPDPGADLSAVVRPRTTPLLTPFVDHTGRRRMTWTTFSADQVDLDYAEPEVLLAMTEVLLGYVARGARMLRLDAVAFLWKQPGTSCVHLPETHEVVRLWRTVLDAVAPGTLLVTETNVPHEENLSYFGAGDDEAHLVYQFALPPLTLDAFHSGDATRLTDWADRLAAPSPTTSFLNFLASHDGIGLRAAEGLLPPAAVDRLCAAAEAGGGFVSQRTGPDGRSTPYELNAVYLDALRRPGAREPQSAEVRRFLAAHGVMLSLAGVPLLYFHSLVGSRNWTEGARQTGRARVVNRERLDRALLDAELADPGSMRRQVLDGMLGLLRVRSAEPAFHPNATQRLVRPADSAHFTVQRTALAGGSTVLCVTDVSGRDGRFRARPPDRLPGGARLVDLLDGTEHVTEADGTVDVPVRGYGVRWLRFG